MIDYTIDKQKTSFTNNFDQIVCEFSYIDKDDRGDSLKLYGTFTVDMDWDGYFKDEILKRFLECTEKEWINSFETPDVLNDIFYNKIVEYIKLAKDSNGNTVIEIDDEELIKVDIVDHDTDAYSEQEELDVFDAMFHNVQFIEQFKDSLSNPAKDNLVHALEYFKKHQSIYAEESATTKNIFASIIGELVC